MLPVGPLMIEHRRIERMIKVLSKEVSEIESRNKVTHHVIYTAVDFIRTYADQCHHGKEEDILFRDLAKKQLSDEHRRILDELVDEHKKAREMTRTVVELTTMHQQGEHGVLPELTDTLKTLIEFYPRHIEKEDRHFFIPIMDYFSDDEKKAMLDEEYTFDQNLIHEKYEKTVSGLEQKFGIEK